MGAHPRSRGEHPPSSRPVSAFAGSSPLTRGARHVCSLWSGLCGLIPAHAGSTRWGVLDPGHTEAHPRSRGEHPCFGHKKAPPRWLIPAHAGSTRLLAALTGRATAHPRSRGEHEHALVAWLSLPGSSPLTRGARRPEKRGARRERLIPAHAGSTCLDSLGHAPRSAHPRSRGEHASSSFLRSARGGLIPAHAGSTPRRSRGWSYPRAHPRSRGEHTRNNRWTK